MSWPKRIQNY